MQIFVCMLRPKLMKKQNYILRNYLKIQNPIHTLYRVGTKKCISEDTFPIIAPCAIANAPVKQLYARLYNLLVLYAIAYSTQLTSGNWPLR